MLTLNKVDVSGKILSETVEHNGKIFMVQQLVAGVIDTQFPIFIPGKLVEEVNDLNIGVNDTVVITNGLLYQKENEWKIKLQNISDIQKIVIEKEDMDLGFEEADEKFI